MAFPAALDITNAADESELQSLLESLVAQCKELPGGQAETVLTISGGSITLTRWIHSVDTESAAATDDLTNASLTNLEDGALFILSVENAARVVTVKHNAGGSGYFDLLDDADAVLDATTKAIVFYADKSGGTHFARELARFGFEGWRRRVAVTSVATGPTTISAESSGRVYTNKGASAQTDYTLPAAAAGLEFEFVNFVAQAIQVTAATGDKIRDGTTLSVSGGEIQSAAALGATVRLVCTDDEVWQVMSKTGTWTVT